MNVWQASVAAAAALLTAAALHAAEFGPDADGPGRRRAAPTDRSGGFYGYADWDSRSGSHDRGRRQDGAEGGRNRPAQNSRAGPGPGPGGPRGAGAGQAPDRRAWPPAGVGGGFFRGPLGGRFAAPAPQGNQGGAGAGPAGRGGRSGPRGGGAAFGGGAGMRGGPAGGVMGSLGPAGPDDRQPRPGFGGAGRPPMGGGTSWRGPGPGAGGGGFRGRLGGPGGAGNAAPWRRFMDMAGRRMRNWRVGPAAGSFAAGGRAGGARGGPPWRGALGRQHGFGAPPGAMARWRGGAGRAFAFGRRFGRAPLSWHARPPAFGGGGWGWMRRFHARRGWGRGFGPHAYGLGGRHGRMRGAFGFGRRGPRWGAGRRPFGFSGPAAWRWGMGGRWRPGFGARGPWARRGRDGWGRSAWAGRGWDRGGWGSGGGPGWWGRGARFGGWGRPGDFRDRGW
jgi:hypothetical protein